MCCAWRPIFAWLCALHQTHDAFRSGGLSEESEGDDDDDEGETEALIAQSPLGPRLASRQRPRGDSVLTEEGLFSPRQSASSLTDAQVVEPSPAPVFAEERAADGGDRPMGNAAAASGPVPRALSTIHEASAEGGEDEADGAEKSGEASGGDGGHRHSLSRQDSVEYSIV